MERTDLAMPISKIGQRRQVVIPKKIFEGLKLEIGGFVEIQQVRGTVVIKPKKLVDAEDILTPQEEAVVRMGERQLRRGRSRPWSHIKHELAR